MKRQKERTFQQDDCGNWFIEKGASEELDYPFDFTDRLKELNIASAAYTVEAPLVVSNSGITQKQATPIIRGGEVGQWLRVKCDIITSAATKMSAEWFIKVVRD